MEEDAGDQPPLLAVQDDAHDPGSHPSRSIAAGRAPRTGTPEATIAPYTSTQAPMKIGVITTRGVAEKSAVAKLL